MWSKIQKRGKWSKTTTNTHTKRWVKKKKKNKTAKWSENKRNVRAQWSPPTNDTTEDVCKLVAFL